MESNLACLTCSVAAVACAEFGPGWLMVEAVSATEGMLRLMFVRNSHRSAAAL